MIAHLIKDSVYVITDILFSLGRPEIMPLTDTLRAVAAAAGGYNWLG